jgi:hypothetical protein
MGVADGDDLIPIILLHHGDETPTHPTEADDPNPQFALHRAESRSTYKSLLKRLYTRWL